MIIKPSSLGDIVHALPVLAALRAAKPEAHITWLVATPFAPLLEGHPLLNDVIRFDRRHFGRMISNPRISADFAQFARELRQRRFDLVIDLQGLFRSAFLAIVSGAPRRIGFAAAREMAWLFYTQRVRCDRHIRHAVDRNLRVAAALNLPGGAPQFPLGLREEERERARRLLSEAGGGPIGAFTAVVPGARWETKLWKPQRLAALIDELSADGPGPCVLLGAPDDRWFTDEIVRQCRRRPVDLVGRTSLRDLAALLDLSQRVVCHDSGPMHIAAALNKPLVALFGPTDPLRCGPYSANARVVATKIECAPCYRRSCWHHSCMERLPLSTVTAEVRRLVAPAER